MANIDGDEVLRQLKQARSRTPKHSGTISQNGNVLARARGNKPLEAETISEKPLSPKKSFLKQIQNYNDFLVQNDLDAEKINLDHDYDFSAFTSARDWKIESQRLADRLSDRKIEIKQNEDAGEFAGMELENGVPSFESTKNMSDEEFKAYEQKYLLPSKGETLREPVSKQIKPNSTVAADTVADGSKLEEPFKLAKPNAFKHSGDIKSKSSSKVAVPSDVGSRITDKPFDPYSADGVRDFVQDGIGSLFRSREEGRDRRYLPKALYIEQQKRNARNAEDLKLKTENRKLEQIQRIKARAKAKAVEDAKPKPKYDRSFSTILKNSLPYPVKFSLEQGTDAIESLKKVRQQAGQHNTGRSLGLGVMEGLADTTGSVLDLGGLAKNRVADIAHSSADWWKSKQTLPESEAGKVGSSVGGDAVLGLVGGGVGRLGGSIYKGMRHSAEDARKKIIRLANEKAIKRTGKIDTDALDLERLKQYEQMTGTTPPDPYYMPLSAADKVKQFMRADTKYDSAPTLVKGVDKISNTIKKEFGTNGMIRKNDDQLAAMFEKTNDLNKARAMQKNQWDQLPTHGFKLGAVLGAAMNGEDDEDNVSGSSPVGTPTKHPAPLINPMRKKTGGGMGTGVGSMSGNGRVKINSGI